MKNIEEINKSNIQKILEKKKIPEFFAGDTIKVGVRIVEGKRERIQYSSKGFVLQKKIEILIQHLQFVKFHLEKGVERTFALYSSNYRTQLRLVRSGKVKRAKLYYLRDRKGKSARISEKIAKKELAVDVFCKIL